MTPITVQTTVKASLDKVWRYWTEPAHINQWAFATDDWEADAKENDVRVGGKFLTTMGAKDGSTTFDFTGSYTAVTEHKLLEYTLDDSRKVQVVFEEVPEGVQVTQAFDPESQNSEELQRSGWQAFLDNFKKHAEA